MKKFTLILLSIVLLSSCSKYKLDRDYVTEEEKAAYKIQLEENLGFIKSPPPPADPEGPAPFKYYLEAAAAADELNKIKLAIELYKEAKEDHPAFEVIYNNLGRLYEELGMYDEAVEEYTVLVERFGELNRYYDITWAYIRAGDRKTAEKYFNLWQNAMQKTDEHTQEKLKELRAQEK